MITTHFVRLTDALRRLETDPATANDPIKRMFFCDGQYVSANVSILDERGLMAYAINMADFIGHAAVYVDKILKGAKPADLPVEQPKKFELSINLKTAKVIGVAVTQSLLLRADEVIQ